MKKVVSVSLNEDGTIKGLLFEGNKRPTAIKTVLVMLERKADAIDFKDTGIQVVTKSDGTKYLRSTPNDTVEDNFSVMAKQVKAEEAQKDMVWEEIKEVEKENPGFLSKIKTFLFGLK